VDVFPDKVRTAILEASAAMPCPPDYFATPFVALAGSSIGGSRRLAIKPSHVQGVTLYAAVVAPPGSAKSPALEKVMDPVRDAEEKIFQDWQQDMAAYKSAMEAYEAAKKKRENLVPQKPTRPVLTRLTVTDATAEALVPILQENPRGVTMVRDELTAWIASMNQYREGGRGADQQFWLSAWSNSTVLVDRKKTHDEGPLYVRQPYISVIGGLTPEKLKTLRGDRSRQKAEQDGFMDRLLFSHPSEPRVVAENWSNVSKESLNQLGEVLTALREVQGASVQDEKGGARSRPWIVKLTDDAKKVWQKFTADHAVERNADDFPDHLAGPWAKLKGYAGRLALILHYIRQVCKETDSEDVDGESMSRGVTLANYFKDHARKVYAVMDADPRVAAARKVVRWIKKNNLARFRQRDAHYALKGSFKTIEDLEPVLSMLVKHFHIRPEAVQRHQGPGRPPGPSYEVNPALHTCAQNPQNPQNPNFVDSVDIVRDVEEEHGDGAGEF
jgi:hypothetical protein